MIIANLNALKSTVIAVKDTLAFMSSGIDKVGCLKINCLIDAQEYVEMALEDLKELGFREGMPTAIQSLEGVLKSLDSLKGYALDDIKKENNAVDELIVAQSNAVAPMVERVIKCMKNYKSPNASKVLQLMDSSPDGASRYQEFVKQVAKESNVTIEALEEELEPFI